ncbi:hypothetical protein PsAD2_04117 [Pseudovibrio axinellae]|uniref:Uncharacterized protein n=1 Tax=Pseudovibrio axinellae TaxID=989403 RepID=A0A165TZB9_9HYPH|nr:hypothetical protein [Pseudovibrio axinellae]KZL08664.1 hypothetical protein PsAD2_04117 [Pseudovibrio axinellae]SER86940.1 hypothetical protein SAMN05421798_1431 [Pseudovibrio axinellae]
MLHQSTDFSECIKAAIPAETLEIPLGSLELYLSKAADYLLEKGYLNFIIRDRHENLLGCRISEFQNEKATTANQENLVKSNASCIMHMWLVDNQIFAQHWDGFISQFDIGSFILTEQKFVK